MVIAARMHCGINAIICGVSAIFLSYSEKSRGMARLVYGVETSACIPLAALDENNLDSILQVEKTLSIAQDLNDQKQLYFSAIKERLMSILSK